MGGFSREEVIGKTSIELGWVRQEDRGRLIRELKETGRIAGTELTLFAKDGRPIHSFNQGEIITIQGHQRLLSIAVDISERIKAQEALMESEERYRRLFEVESDAIFLVDSETGRIIEANAAALNLYGYNREELLALRNTDLSAEPDKTKRVVDEQQPRVLLRWHCKKDGTVFPVEVTLSYFQYKGRKMYVVALRDISERIQAERALRESEERLNMALAASEMGVWEWELHTNAVFWSTESLNILGVENVPPTMESFMKAMHPEDAARVVTAANQALAEKKDFKAEFRIIRPNGEMRWISNHARGKYDENGKPLRLVGIAQDITERKEAEETINKLSRQNELILNSADEGICGLDNNGLITFINPAGARLCGYEPEELIGRSLHGAVHYAKLDGSPYPEGECSVYNVLISGKPTYIMSDVFWRKDGSSFFVASSCSPVLEDNAIIGAVVTFRDVTEHQITLQALEESEKKYRTIFEQSKDAIVVTTPDGIILDINAAGLQLFGYESKDEVLNIDIARNIYASQQDRAAFRAVLEHQGSVSDYELRLKRTNGEGLTVLYTSNLSKNDKGETIFQSIIRDVTEQRKLQRQLLQSQKMEAVGQLAGGIAHDFNNILSTISGYGYLIKTGLRSNDPLKADVEQILESVNRAAEVTHSLLAFSRKQRINPTPNNINELIKKVVKLLSRIIGEDIEVDTMLADEDIICIVDAAQIQQVLMNLATNARDAMPRGGRLFLKTEIAQVDDNFIMSNGFGEHGAYAVISVSDTGIGMNPETMARIFEPFYTTKETGKGTGLGLAMVYGIIKQHEGYILANSELGRGSTFYIYLPTIMIDEFIVEPPYEAEIRGGTETILMAEDDDKLRKLYGNVSFSARV